MYWRSGSAAIVCLSNTKLTTGRTNGTGRALKAQWRFVFVSFFGTSFQKYASYYKIVCIVLPFKSKSEEKTRARQPPKPSQIHTYARANWCCWGVRSYKWTIAICTNIYVYRQAHTYLLISNNTPIAAIIVMDYVYVDVCMTIILS